MSGGVQSIFASPDSVDSEHVDEFELYVENIGGIEETTVRFGSGVSILAGENATNRSSLLSAINGVLGGSMGQLKSDTDSGRVELRPIVDGDSEPFTVWERTYTKSGDTVVTDGNPVMDDPELIDTYVSLFEANDARQAITTGEGLRDVLLRPVNVDEIQHTLREKTTRRDEIQTEIKQIERDLEREPKLEEERTQLQEDLDTIESDIADLRETVSEYEADADVAEEAEELVDELEETRDTERSLENDLAVHESKLEALEEEYTEKRSALRELYEDRIDADDVDIPDESDGEALRDFSVSEHTTHEDTISDLESELSRTRGEVSQIKNTIEELARVVEFNEDSVNNPEQLAAVTATEESQSDPLSKLTESEEIQCWTCGSNVEKQRIESRTEELRNLLKEKRVEKGELEDTIDDINDSISDYRALEREEKSLKSRLEEIEQEKAEIEDQIEAVESQLADVRDTIETLQTKVDETADLRDSDLLDGYEELSEKQYERGRIENRIDEITESLNELDDRRDEKETLSTELGSVRSDIEDLRNRVSDIEKESVEAFNGHMESIIDELAYENIARVWIERKVDDSGRSTTSEFELHVIRETEDGAAYEDTVDTLSESEREVIGLVVGFAGYLVHDLPDMAPYILLDSVEMIDAGRLRSLIDYMAEHSEMVVAALLPEDAAAMPDEYARITADRIAAK